MNESDEAAKTAMLAFSPETGGEVPRWHLPNFNVMPSRPKLFDAGMSGIAKGWVPEKPLIKAETRVLAIGSCFASNFILWLAEHGFNRHANRSPYSAFERRRAGFESVAVLAQQFRWAFDEVDPSSLLWIDKNREVIAATDDAKRGLRTALENTDVLVLTLGLSEVWYDQVSGEPLWRALTKDRYDPDRHVFRVESVETTRYWLNAIESIRRRHLPHLKVVYTVSPIPLKATFRPVSAVTANSVSKAILRAALDEFLREHEDVLNKSIFYFPSYEFVTQLFSSPYQEDNEHVTTYVASTIMSFFAATYCDLADARERTAGSLSTLSTLNQAREEMMQLSAQGHAVNATAELEQRVRELERGILQLTDICEQRAKVIAELDQAATERLALIEQIQHAADKRLAAMHELARVAEERLAVIQRLDAELTASRPQPTATQGETG